MYLSRLEIQGFKSFATPTQLHFDPGITAIVGPNGCGKSNVVDALRWVIGEQRARVLRSERMDSVIFNGTTRRRALGMAEVLLTVQNTRGLLPTEFSEVTIGRRLFRSGESEYLLNDTPCRLRDIVDLFLDTGMGAGAYSVIELKMVEEILSTNAHDRRRLFEEAAGVTKYKMRREQALRKLESLRADLVRVHDLTQEVARNVARLDRQSKAAARYKTLEDRIRVLTLSLASAEHAQMAQELDGIRAEVERIQQVISHLQAERASHEAVLQARKKSHIDNEQQLVSCDRALVKHQTRLQQLSADLRLKNERRDTVQRDLARSRTGRQQAQDEAVHREKVLDALRAELAHVRPQQHEAAEALALAQSSRDTVRKEQSGKRSAMNRLLEEYDTLSSRHAAQRRRYDQAVARIELHKKEHARLTGDAESLEHAFQRGRADVESAAQARKRAQRALTAAAQVEVDAEAEHQRLQGKINDADQRVRALSRNHAARKAEAALLDALVSGYEDFPEAAKYLAKTQGKLTTISDVLLTDPAYHEALGAALGPLGACVIVSSVSEVHAAVALLRGEQKGRSLFIVLDQLPPDIASTPPRPGATPLLNVVTVTDSIYAPLARLVLHGMYVSDGAEILNLIPAQGCVRMVTRTGEWVDQRGFTHAGSLLVEASARHFDRRASLDEARSACNTLAQDLEKQRALQADLQQRQDALELGDKRDAHTSATHVLASAQRQEAHLIGVLESMQERQARLAESIGEILSECDTLAAVCQASEVADVELSRQIAEIKERIAASQQALEAGEAYSRQVEDSFSSARLRHQEVLSRMDRIQSGLLREEKARAVAEDKADHWGREIAALKEAHATLGNDIEALEETISAERGRRGSLDHAVRQAKTRMMENRVEIDQLEQAVRKLHRKQDELARQEHDHALHVTSLSVKMEDMVGRIHDRYSTVIGSEHVLEDLDTVQMREELEEAQSQLDRMGRVNLLALEEHDRERERHEFMITQYEDLQKAETTLLQTAEEINKTAAERFSETFEIIRSNFSKLFTELFGQGARADLLLDPTADMLESPIMIKAQPHGKRPVSIAQLSSGEKTLTAIALLFAIYLVKPSPFCFLDEVDAPLDDANVARFMRLIRRFSLDTQFVLVTHNARTMEMADRLYGITMQEEGVSRLVGVRFDEAMALTEPAYT